MLATGRLSMSLSATAAKPLGSRLIALETLHKPQGIAPVVSARVTSASLTPWQARSISHASSSLFSESSFMLGQAIGATARHRISSGVCRRGAISVPVAAFVLASVFSIGPGRAAMAEEVPLNENSDEVTKSGVATFNTRAAQASRQLNGDSRYKIVHFVRHGEGYHNIGFESLDDTHLTANGWSQAAKLQKHINNLEKPLDVETVIVSPLTRTLETASGVFGGGTIENGAKVLMIEQMPVHNEVTHHYAIAKRPGLPILAQEQCRERMSLNRCDRRRNLTETARNFPGVDFSLIETEEDVLWDKKHDEAVSAGAVGSRYFIGEKGDAVTARGVKFVKWLMERPEKHLSVVTHCAFLHQTLSAVSKDCSPELAQSLSRDFRNCEMRSVVFNKEGKPVEILRDTYYSGGAPRYYLFPLNWAKQTVGSIVGGVSKGVHRVKNGIHNSKR